MSDFVHLVVSALLLSVMGFGIVWILVVLVQAAFS